MPGTVLYDPSLSDDPWVDVWKQASSCWEDPDKLWWVAFGCASKFIHDVADNPTAPSFDLEEFKRAFMCTSYPFVASSQATWNTNGLLTSDPCIYQKKACRAAKLVNCHDVSCLQEVHGDAASLAIFYDRISDRVQCSSSNRVNKNL